MKWILRLLVVCSAVWVAGCGGSDTRVEPSQSTAPPPQEKPKSGDLPAPPPVTPD